ncbi:MAG: phosphatidylserine decarboxylase family protein [Candidatus Marinimicrobia bacterium]|nr:phosphatidylserine decarboxylase family protein [Candidatus Neomarinimicrobiota bacterium]
MVRMIAREGLKIIFTAFVLSFILLMSALYFDLSFLMVLFWIVFGFFLFSMWFFRDPERKTPAGENLIVSPADGKIVAIRPEKDDDIGNAVRVSIFMSIFSVHVNRIPLGGIVKNMEYSKGRFLSAMKPEASFENEHNTVLLKNEKINLKFSQIAGLIARRIVSYLHIDGEVKTGERCGLIKFGSRVDVVVPETVKINVQIGDKVTAGVSIIGVIQ